MPIPLGGLATGLDTNSLIQQLLSVEARPVTLLETRKLKLQAQSAAFLDLNGKLEALKTRAEAVADPATFFSRTVTSSDDTVATATAATGTLRGTYTLTATALAKGSIAAGANTKDALTDVVAAGIGTFEFRLGASGTLVSLDVDTTTTLEQLVAAINDEDAGVKASAVNAGTAAAPAWKLTLTSIATGAANDIVIVTDGTTLAVANTQAATDAGFTIAGLGSFTRPTNVVTDVLDGVTITLKASSGSTDLAIDYDKGGTQSRLQALVDAYNDVVRLIDGQTLAKKGSDGKLTPGAFTGDVIPRQIRSTLSSKIATALDGTYGTLAELGITTKTDGTLTLDSAKLQQALSDAPDAVSTLVAGTSTKDGIADLLVDALTEATKSVTGTIALRRDGITTSIRNLDTQIDQAKLRLEARERLLRERFNRLEQTISRLQSTGDSLLSQLASLNTKSRK